MFMSSKKAVPFDSVCPGLYVDGDGARAVWRYVWERSTSGLRSFQSQCKHRLATHHPGSAWLSGHERKLMVADRTTQTNGKIGLGCRLNNHGASCSSDLRTRRICSSSACSGSGLTLLTLRAIIAPGKFHGLITPTTPTGCLTVTTRFFRILLSVVLPYERMASLKQSMNETA